MIALSLPASALSDYDLADLTDYGARVRAHRNESPIAPPPHVVTAVREMDADVLRYYPAALQRRFAKRLALRLAVAPRNLAIGSGCDEMLLAIARCALAPGDNAVTVRPAFGMYARAVSAAGASLRRLRYECRWKLDSTALLRLVDARTKLIVLGHPNNPTGDALAPEDLVRIARAVPDALILVDETYLSLRASSLVRYAGAPPNVAVAGSLSKVCGLAGLRVGYAVAHGLVARAIRRAIAPYPLSGASLVAADAFLAEAAATRAYELAYDAQVARSLNAIEGALAPLGVDVMRGQANFALADFGFPARPLAKALRRRGIAVRTFSDPELATSLRFCALDDAGTAELIEAFRALVPGIRAGGVPVNA